MCRLFSKVEVDIVCHVPRQYLQYLQSKSATSSRPHEPSTPPQKQTSLPNSSVECCRKAYTARGDLSSSRIRPASLLPLLSLGRNRSHRSRHSLRNRRKNKAACIIHHDTTTLKHHADVPLLPRTVRLPCSPAAVESGQSKARARTAISASPSCSCWPAIATSKPIIHSPPNDYRLSSSATTAIRRIPLQTQLPHDVRTRKCRWCLHPRATA